ncbi:MAG: alpha/beta hydrolase [Spirochaetales bacterium]|nr:alpha/beta hydrolase [Spirochaetales bacterium]
MSAGGSTALRFAIEYPEMTASLTLLSCGIQHFDLSEDTEARARAEKLVKILGSDFIFWSLSGIFRQTIAGFAGVPRDVFSHLNPDEKKAGMDFIKFMNPASIRREGILIDQFQPRPDSDIASINAPTLIIHAEDDGIQQYQNALFAFDLIGGSQFLSFEKGGHMVMVTEREKIKNALKDHLEQAEREEGL